MEALADPHGGTAQKSGGLAKAQTTGDHPRTGMLCHLLRELQHDAQQVFASSGETVDRFLRDRRTEAQQPASAPA